MASSLPKPIRNNASDLLREQNHANHYYHGGPEQQIANRSAPDGTLFGAMLLPESESNQRNGNAQEPRTERVEKRTGKAHSNGTSKSQRQAASDRCDRCHDCGQ